MEVPYEVVACPVNPQSPQRTARSRTLAGDLPPRGEAASNLLCGVDPMTVLFKIEPLRGADVTTANQPERYESLYHAMKAAEHIAESKLPPVEIQAIGFIGDMWDMQIEQGIFLWQSYQFRGCDGWYDHVDDFHSDSFAERYGDEVLYCEAGIVHGINGASIGTYVACKMCNIVRIRLFVCCVENDDFICDART